jgi:hypothetical protein
MSYDESEMISDCISYGWLDVDKENKVTCWNEGKTYKATITFEEIKEDD